MRLPAVTAPKFNPEGASAEIDERVRRILSDALSVYRVDVELLRRLQPDFIVTQSQCEACAVSLREVEQAVVQWIGNASPRIISLAPSSLPDILAEIERVGVELGQAERGMKLAESLRSRLTAIERRSAGVRTRPTVACIEWLDPLITAANWMPELVAMAGGHDVFGLPGEHSARIKFEQLWAADPDVILLTPCGFNMERTAAELGAVTKQPQWPLLKAARQNRVYVADGNQYFNRPGPRIVESLEILAEMLHPETFSFGHEGSGWRRL